MSLQPAVLERRFNEFLPDLNSETESAVPNYPEGWNLPVDETAGGLDILSCQYTSFNWANLLERYCVQLPNLDTYSMPLQASPAISALLYPAAGGVPLYGPRPWQNVVLTWGMVRKMVSVLAPSLEYADPYMGATGYDAPVVAAWDPLLCAANPEEAAFEDIVERFSGQVAVDSIFVQRYKGEIQVQVVLDLDHYDFDFMDTLIDREMSIRDRHDYLVFEFYYPHLAGAKRREIVHPGARCIFTR